MDYDVTVQVRMSQQLRDKAEAMALDDRRKLSDWVRVLIERKAAARERSAFRKAADKLAEKKERNK